MGEKQLLGCAWCERPDVDVGICCRHHVRLVCADCEGQPAFLAEHEPAVEAS
jgi:hypothetical protein